VVVGALGRGPDAERYLLLIYASDDVGNAAAVHRGEIMRILSRSNGR
jgi:hypothetical protein